MIKPNLKYALANNNCVSEEFEEFLPQDPIAVANMARSLDRPVEVPSLSKICLFKLRNYDVTEYLENFECSYIDKYVIRH